jgi:hypothetical protein
VLSWYLGIVVWNSDLAFTLTNVVAHGVPYFTLVWIRNRQEPHSRSTKLSWRATLLGIFCFCLLAALLEESLWDRWVWLEHLTLFPFVTYLPSIPDTGWIVLLPLLALPQVTHYILDGFIWRKSEAEVVV